MKAHEQQQLDTVTAHDPAQLWQEIRPHLHEALDGLSAADRDAVLLRFYEQLSYRDLAQNLAITEEAAKKRVQRALDRLRVFFSRKGVGLTAGALAGVLGQHAAEAVPAALAGQVAQVALAGAGTTLAATSTLTLTKGALSAMSIATAKTAATVIGAAIIVTGTALWVSHRNQPSPPVSTDGTPAPQSAASSTAALPVPTVVASTQKPPALPAPMEERLTAETLKRLILEAVAIEDPSQRAKKLREIMSRLGPDDLAWALASMDQIPLGQRQTKTFNTSGGGSVWFEITTGGRADAIQALLFRWGQLDPAGAMAKAGQLGDGMNNWVGVLVGWIDTDPVAAIAHIRQNPQLNTKTSRNMLQYALGVWAQKDPQAAAGFLTSLTDSDGLKQAASDIASSWAMQDPVAASHWAGTLTDVTVRTQAYTGIAFLWGRDDRDAAGTWINGLPSGPDRDAALSAFSRQLATGTPLRDGSVTNAAPQAAAKWAAQIADERVRAVAYNQIGSAITKQDPAAALAWLESLPADTARDQAVFSASMQAGPEEPAAAITWAGLIRDDSIRAQAYGSIVYWWAWRDRVAATAWVNQLPDGPARDAASAALEKAIVAKPAIK